MPSRGKKPSGSKALGRKASKTSPVDKDSFPSWLPPLCDSKTSVRAQQQQNKTKHDKDSPSLPSITIGKVVTGSPLNRYKTGGSTKHCLKPAHRNMQESVPRSCKAPMKDRLHPPEKRKKSVGLNEERKLRKKRKTKLISNDPVVLARYIISMPRLYTIKEKKEVYRGLLLTWTSLDKKVEVRGVRQPPNCFRLLAHSNVLRKLLNDLGRVITADDEEAKLRACYTGPGFTK